MTSLIVIALCVFLAVIAFEFVKRWLGPSDPANSYKLKPLLSANEKEFYNRLSEAVPDCRILTQVALGALLLPNVRSNNYCIIAEWSDMDSLVRARPNMIATLDSFRHTLEDLGGGLGVTDPVSGPVVLELK